MSDYTIRVKRYEPTDPRLGRHVHHDSRSKAYPHPTVDDPTTLTSVRHERNIPILDQGQVGSCTGNAATGCMGTAEFWFAGQADLSDVDAQIDERYALGVYSDAETIDGDGPYPPNDYGSTGLSVAKVLKNRGLISGYTHAFDLNAALNALANQPVIIGIPWHADMFNPASDGRLSIGGPVEGGHEIVLDELDVENERVWLSNSWGESWGVEGRAYLAWKDFGALLADDGDCTVFTPLSQPAPTPQPEPEPAPAPTPDVDTFIAAALEWLSHDHRHSKVNEAFVGPLSDYLQEITT